MVSHNNVFPAFSELRYSATSASQTWIISNSTLGIGSFLYVLAGMFGYLQFRENTEGNIVNNFASDDELILAGRLGLVIMLLVSVVLLLFSCRRAILDLILGSAERAKSSHELIASTLIFVAWFGLSIVLSKVEQVMALAGAIFGSCTAFIFPAMLYLKIVNKRTKMQTLSVYIVAAAGFVILIMGTFVAIREIVNNPPTLKVEI